MCILQHRIFLDIYFLFAYETTQLFFEEEGTGHRVVHFYSFWLKIQRVCISSLKISLLWSYPREGGFSSYALTPGRPIRFVPRGPSCLPHRFPALTWSTSGFYKIPLQRLRGMNASRENHTGHVTLEEVRRKSVWHLIRLTQLEDYLTNRTANWLQTRGWI